MIDLATHAGRSYAVLGLARSGLAAATALLRGGAAVIAWDDDQNKRADAKALGVPIGDLLGADWDAIEALVMSPGIPHTHPSPHPAAAFARKRGKKLICDIELLAQAQRESFYIGVTGTNGKSTTTALVAHLLKLAGRRVAVGGNIGAPVLALEPAGAEGIYVLEMSSYQLELVHDLVFDVAVLLNVSPDHLDRHGGMTGYVAAKARIFAGDKKQQTAVIGVDDEICRALHADLVRRAKHKVIAISSGSRLARGVFAQDGLLFDALEGDAAHVADLRAIATLPGRHNGQNAAAAYATARTLGVAAETAARALASFPGLAHRQELVARIGRVVFVNDSKATNADAAARALDCYRKIFWIAGGVPKEGGIGALAPWFDRIARAYLIGEAAPEFAATLGARAPHVMSRTLEAALAAAAADAAQAGGEAVVLLSPACASFDQFANFEARGDAFRRLALALPGAVRIAAQGGRA
jgi:UDP-N-acetylmuramoylalanine--D-glutamate ligase